MKTVKFDWDAGKDRANQRKHGVAFAEARSVFYDDQAVEYYDPDHSDAEDRFIMVGMSAKLRIMVVCYTRRKDGTDDMIRIISARRATKKEQAIYIGGRT
jgi:uncharacterized protein